MDAVEVVTFGKAQFFRTLEKPKPFLLPINDYEVVEVREPRMVLKNVGSDRSIKIGQEKKAQQPKPQQQQQQRQPEPEVAAEERGEDKKRGGKRSDRRRRGGKSQPESETVEAQSSQEEPAQALAAAPSPSAMSALLAPPTTLISETLTRYRRDEAFKQAFYEKEEGEGIDAPIPEAIPTDEEFDEGDHVLFRGHEPVSDYKTAEEPETEFFPKEEVPFNEEPL